MIDWILLSLISAVFLGFYDVAKKASLKDNAVPPVLLSSVATAATIWIVPVLLANGQLGESSQWGRELIDLSWRDHGLILFKSILVGASWTFAFFALKHLPLSIASPIRATSPLCTIFLAVVWMGELPQLGQWIGIVIVVATVLFFSRVGANEGIHFHRDRYVALMAIATLLGAISALFDKYLLQTEGLSPITVQAWFSIYLVPVMLPLAIRWWMLERKTVVFQWRWSIPLIALLLLIADFAYFQAIRCDGALISVISPLRRASIIIPFVFGVVRLNEQNWKPKALCVVAMLVGVFLISQTSTHVS